MEDREATWQIIVANTKETGRETQVPLLYSSDYGPVCPPNRGFFIEPRLGAVRLPIGLLFFRQ